MQRTTRDPWHGSPALKPLWDRIVDFTRLVLQGHATGATRVILGRIYSRPVDLGLVRDLSLPVQPPEARIDFELRPLRDDDDLTFLTHPEPGESDQDALLRLNQLRLVHAAIPTCYVAVTPDRQIAFMQWIIVAPDIPRMQALYGSVYPSLAHDEVLMEGGYAPRAYRGKGLMSAGLARVAALGTDCGAKRAYTFVAEDHLVSLRACKRSGFVPALQRTFIFFCFFRFVRFSVLPPGTPYPFDKVAALPALSAPRP